MENIVKHKIKQRTFLYKEKLSVTTNQQSYYKLPCNSSFITKKIKINYCSSHTDIITNCVTKSAQIKLMAQSLHHNSGIGRQIAGVANNILFPCSRVWLILYLSLFVVSEMELV